MTFINDEMRKEEFRRQIVDGPSKFDLMMALLDRRPPRMVQIALDEGISDDGPAYGRKIQLLVTGADVVRDGETEHVPGESWTIRGALTFSVRGHGQSLSPSPRSFEAHFRTDCRKGSIVIRPQGYGRR